MLRGFVGIDTSATAVWTCSKIDVMLTRIVKALNVVNEGSLKLSVACSFIARVH